MQHFCPINEPELGVGQDAVLGIVIGYDDGERKLAVAVVRDSSGAAGQ